MSQHNLDFFAGGGAENRPRPDTVQPALELVAEPQELIISDPELQHLITHVPTLQHIIDEQGYVPFDESQFPRGARRQRTGETFRTNTLKNYGDDVEIYKDVLTREQEAYLGKHTAARTQVLSAIVDAEAQARIIKREATALQPDHFPPELELTPAQLAVLTEVLQDGQTAKDIFILHNLRLVMKMAKKSLTFVRHMELEDLIQEGNTGLEHAVDMFDWTKGFKFSTYAKWWIEQNISRGIARQERTIRYSLDTDESVRKIFKAMQKLDTGQEPNLEQVAKAAKLPVEKVQKLMPYVSMSVISLDMPAGEDSTLADTLPGQPGAHEEPDLLHDKESIVAALDRLDERRRFVVVHYFGLLGNEPRSMAEIKVDLGVNRSRVGQYYQEAMKSIGEYLVRTAGRD